MLYDSPRRYIILNDSSWSYIKLNDSSWPYIILNNLLESSSLVLCKYIVFYVYCDADWTGEIESRNFTSGYVFRSGDCAISWKSKKQSVVTLFSNEAEYVALVGAVCLRKLLLLYLCVFSDITISLQPHWFETKIQSIPVCKKHIIEVNLAVRESWLVFCWVNQISCITRRWVVMILLNMLTSPEKMLMSAKINARSAIFDKYGMFWSWSLSC